MTYNSCHFDLRNGPFRIAKRPVLDAETDRFASQNDMYLNTVKIIRMLGIDGWITGKRFYPSAFVGLEWGILNGEQLRKSFRCQQVGHQI